MNHVNGFNPIQRAAAVLLLLAASTGCSFLQPQNWRTMPDMFTMFGGSGGELNVKSISDEDVTYRGGFERGIYTMADGNTATIILYDGPAESPSQAVTIRMFWNPQSGRTPVDPSATNATIQYIVFGDDGKQLAIYSGAGYFYPNSELGNDKLTGSVWQSSLRISDKTDGFTDPFGQARMEGKVVVERDDLAIEAALHRLNVQVRERLGRARLVEAQEHHPHGEHHPGRVVPVGQPAAFSHAALHDMKNGRLSLNQPAR